MKNLLFTIVMFSTMKSILLFIFLFILSSSFAQDGVKFKNISLEEACEIAKKENKLIFIDCFTSSCRPCKLLSLNIFPLEEVGDFYNKKFVNLAYDVEKHPDGMNLAKKHNIKAYPTFLFLDNNGEIEHIKVWPGAAKEEIIDAGKEAFNMEIKYKSVINNITQGKRDISLLKAYLESRTAVFNQDSLINTFFHSYTEKQKYSKEYWDLFYNYVDETESPLFLFFINNRKKYESVFGEKIVKRKILRTFEITINSHKNDKEKLNELQLIDPKLFFQINTWLSYNNARISYLQEKANVEKWDNFVAKGKEFFLLERSFPEDLNSFSWTVFENYKQFNDIETLNFADELLMDAILLAPNKHHILDTYAHILYELERTQEAILFEEKAINLAEKENSKNLESYKKALENFKPF